MATSGMPSFAFVKYHDSAKAIVHISLIKKYGPTSINELCKKKLVYWCDTGLLSDHSDEDYYSRTLWKLVVSDFHLKVSTVSTSTLYLCLDCASCIRIAVAHCKLEDVNHRAYKMRLKGIQNIARKTWGFQCTKTLL